MAEEYTPSILIVDDDPNNIEILCLDLEDDGYDFVTASNGAEAWDALQENKADIKTVLVDRMMPVMNGLEFVEKLKADDATTRIPVIMQTAAAEKSQVIEGIKAGVYYYLTKPYEPELMRTLVRAAVNDFKREECLQRELAALRDVSVLMNEGRFEFRTLEEARQLAPFIACFYPDQDRVALGIMELLVNAVEHGNLGITYADKGRMIEENSWEEEVGRLQALPENAEKSVSVHYSRRDSEIELHIKDQGEGFAWCKYLEFSPERAMDSHGRGIAMSKMVSFDSLQYLGCGNEVRGTVKL